MKPMRLATIAMAIGAMLASAPASAAFIWSEQAPGAGETLATAQVTRGATSLNAIDRIQGTLATTVPVGGNPRNEVDLYKIYIDDAAGFSARTESSNPDDTALFLFDASGLGVFMNDDNGFDLLSALPGVGADGFYFLGVALGGFSALDASLNSVFLSGLFTDVLGADPARGALAGWSEGFASFDDTGLSYDIALTGARVAVPEPTTLALLGIAGFAAWRTRRPAVNREVAA